MQVRTTCRSLARTLLLLGSSRGWVKYDGEKYMVYLHMILVARVPLLVEVVCQANLFMVVYQ